MKKVIFVWLLIFLWTSLGLAQSDFRPAYIINYNNDTTYGLIDYKGNKANARKCLFKITEEAEIREFNPKELKAYRFIDSKYYISKAVMKDSIETLLFLEYLVNGIVDIYYYRDNEGEHYLAEDDQGALYELRNDVKEVTRDEKIYEMESQEYIGVLKYIFRKSPEISGKAGNTSLTHKSLIGITKEYHDAVCTDQECIIYEKKLPKITLTYGPLIGLHIIKAAVKEDLPDYVYYLRDARFGTVLSPSAGLYLKINMPYLNERLNFLYEASYSYYVLQTTTSTTDHASGLTFNNDIGLICNNLNNTFLFRYEIPAKKIRPALLAGLFFNYIFKEDYTRDLDVKYPSGDNYYSMTFYESPFSSTEYGLAVGCGITGKFRQHREYLIDLKYQRGFGFEPYKIMNYFIIDAAFHIGR